MASDQQSDQQPDQQPCTTALSNARRACDSSQASSFNSQVSGGSQGLTGAAVATTGTQNVNNIIVNCSNSQQICASACGQAQMPDAQNECQRLETNLKYLAKSADTSFDNASSELTNYSSSAPYLLDENKQKSNAPNDREGSPDPAAREQDSAKNYSHSLRPNQIDLSPAEAPAAPSAVSESIPSLGDMGTTLPIAGVPSQENYALEASLGIPKPYAPGVAGPLINGTAGVEGPSGTAAAGTVRAASASIQAQKAPGEIQTGGGSGGYTPPAYVAIGAEGDGYNSYSKIGAAGATLKQGFSLFANWRSSIRELYEDFMRGGSVSGGKSRTPASDRGRLGSDTELAMEPLPNVPRSRLPDVAFGATILSLSAIGLWRFKVLLALKGALKAAQLADQAQRRLSQRRAADAPDRRIQSSLFREGEAERRKSSSGDRRGEKRAERRLVPRSS